MEERCAFFSTAIPDPVSTMAATSNSPFFPPGVPAPANTGNEQLGPGAPSPFLHESKPAFPIQASHSYATSFFGFLDPLLSPVGDFVDSVASKRRALGLPFPGTAEHLQREVKSTLLTNFFFDGARADLTKALSINPIFQVTHAFSMGATSERGPLPSSYNFGAVYGSERFFLQGGLDDSGSVTVRGNTGLAAGHISKIQAQLTHQPGGSFVQLEHDYQGLDHAANLKCLNPSPTDGSGIYIGNYIQSLTRNFAVGLETMYQRQSADQQEAMMGYMAKYMSTSGDTIATAQLQGQGLLSATYWQRLSDKVEAAADLQIITAAGRREASSTLGAKYDFRMATFRGQIDSAGKVSSQLESRLAPSLSLTIGGEIDHFRSTARFGVGIALESANSDIPFDPNSPPPTPPSVPM